MNDDCGNPECRDPDCVGLSGVIRCPNWAHDWDGVKHVIVTKELKSGYVCMNYQFKELVEAEAKHAELNAALNRREHAYNIAIVSI